MNEKVDKFTHRDRFLFWLICEVIKLNLTRIREVCMYKSDLFVIYFLFNIYNFLYF